jgi:hypothetical protein
MGIQIQLSALDRFNQHADYQFLEETWSNQSVG